MGVLAYIFGASQAVLAIVFVAIAGAKLVTMLKKYSKTDLRRQEQFLLGITRKNIENQNDLVLEQLIAIRFKTSIPRKLFDWAMKQKEQSPTWILTELARAKSTLNIEKSIQTGSPVWKENLNTLKKLSNESIRIRIYYFFTGGLPSYGIWLFLGQNTITQGQLIMAFAAAGIFLALAFLWLAEIDGIEASKRLLQFCESQTDNQKNPVLNVLTQNKN